MCLATRVDNVTVHLLRDLVVTRNHSQVRRDAVLKRVTPGEDARAAAQ
jgi:hypothetical protein